MNTRYAHTVCSYDALLRFQILHCQNQGLNEITITIPRAKEFLRDIEILKKSLEDSKPVERREPEYFSRIDAMFDQQSAVLNDAISKILG
jgi:hypothetical protein